MRQVCLQRLYAGEDFDQAITGVTSRASLCLENFVIERAHTDWISLCSKFGTLMLCAGW